MLYITPKEEVDAYFEQDRASQSHTKTILKGVAEYVKYSGSEEELHYKEKASWVKGSAIDCMLTGEDGEFEKTHHISAIEVKPSEIEMQVLHVVFDELNDNDVVMETSLGDCKDMIELAAGDVDWYKGKPGEKRINTLVQKYTPYFNDLKLAIGKQVLSMGEKGLVDKVVKSLREHPRTAKYFDRERMKSAKNIDFYFQLKGEFELDGWECKFLSDLVVVHKNEKGEITKIQPVDLKTMAGHTIDFPKSIRQWRYDIQAMWYKTGIAQHFDVDVSIIEPMIFVVESTTDIGSPAVFQLDAEYEMSAYTGRAASVVDGVVIQNKVQGIQYALEMLAYYRDHDFQEDWRLIETGKEPLQVGFFGIKNPEA